MNAPTLQVMVEINGEWLSVRHPEVELNVEDTAGECRLIRAAFVNRSAATVRFGGFRFGFDGVFPGIPGERLRLYREGWTMASAAASVRYGECDFEADPGYLKFAVSAPEHYDSATPNRFSAEHVVVLNDHDTGASLLAGFVTSADQLTRFAVELAAGGVGRLDAFSSGDGIEVDPGETVRSETLALMDGPDGYELLQRFAALWGRNMKARTWDHVPTGWCSWYYYFNQVTENDMRENIRYLSAHHAEFPVEYIQLDDGYQHALGDWLTCNEKFPHGLRHLAGEIRAAGFKPGLWLAPFMVEERSHLFAEHPEWMVKDADGNILRVSEWRGCPVAVLDGTHPGAREYLTHIFSTLAEWGFEYVKLDFLAWACAGSGGCYHDRKATRAQAFRRGLQTIRDAMGERFILGCTAPLGQVVGLVNGERIGTDITPYWQPERPFYKEAPTVPNVCRNLVNRSYMNGRLWISDPDTHIARTDNNRLTENEVLLWTFALYFAGGMMLLSDRFETLAPERAELSKLLLAEPEICDTRPLDFFEREYPAVWLRRRRDGALLLGLFNFADEDMELEADFDRIEPDATFACTDFRTGEKLTATGKVFRLKLPPHSCRIVNLAR